MSELGALIAAFRKAELQGIGAVLATVVKVEGSSYRMPGARMLVTEYGEMTGAISGGCLEGDALRRALLALSQQTNKLVTYDTTHESDATIGVQLGCNGIVHILFEYIDSAAVHNPIALLEKLLDQRQPALVATICSLDRYAEQPGTCCVQLHDEVIFKQNGAIDRVDLTDYIEQVFQNQATLRTVIDRKDVQYEVLLEYRLPTIELVIVGAGHDAQPLAEMATMLGWEVTVVDGRATHATPERFKTAKRFVVAGAADVLQHIAVDHYTVMVLMSHNYGYDKMLLQQLLHTACAYIGLLGPKKRLQRMLSELESEGVVITAEAQAKIHGPVGLDIGAETSAEIALAIVAEIKAFLQQRSGNSLRDRTEKMHQNISTI